MTPLSLQAGFCSIIKMWNRWVVWMALKSAINGSISGPCSKVANSQKPSSPAIHGFLHIRGSWDDCITTCNKGCSWRNPSADGSGQTKRNKHSLPILFWHWQFRILADPNNNCIFNSRFNSNKCGLSPFLKGTSMWISVIFFWYLANQQVT